jgi:thymidylate synthase
MPSDFILASLMVMTFAKASGLEPGEIIMDFTDVHCYFEHLEDAKKQLEQETFEFPTFTETITENIYEFNNKMIEIQNYKHSDPIKYLLKA